MKLKILKKYKNKTLYLNLLKLKLYKKKQSSNLEFNSRKIELNLKKISHIIYKYHIKKKKILFLEFPKSFKQILKNTKHILIPGGIFYTDILDNKIVNLNNSSTILKKKKISLNIIKTLLKLNKKIDLIVIYDSSDLYTNITRKSYGSKTPIIYCFNKSSKLDTKIAYKVVTTNKSLDEKILNNNLIFTIIKATLKKAINITKKKKVLPSSPVPAVPQYTKKKIKNNRKQKYKKPPVRKNNSK